MKWSRDGMVSLLRFASKHSGPWDEIADDEYMPDEDDVGLAIAAPDLLEACEDALESIRSGELYTVHLQEILSTAIAKARGDI